MAKALLMTAMLLISGTALAHPHSGSEKNVLRAVKPIVTEGDFCGDIEMNEGDNCCSSDPVVICGPGEQCVSEGWEMRCCNPQVEFCP